MPVSTSLKRPHAMKAAIAKVAAFEDMTELTYTEQARMHLERFSDFLPETEPQAAQKTTALMFDTLKPDTGTAWQPARP